MLQMAKDLFMGIDIGTTGVRAALFDINGSQVGLAYREYPMICTQTGMAELDPNTVFRSFIEVVRECIAGAEARRQDVAAVGLSTQMSSLLAVDKSGKNLTNVLTWADTRSLGQALSVMENHDYMQVYNSTGCRVQHPMYPLSKILWIKESMPVLFGEVYKFVSIKEYILSRLFGEYVIDFTDASTTGLFNIHSFKWDNYILENVAGIDETRLGTPVECTYSLKNLKHEYAEEMGLDKNTPFVVGSGDGILANAGCGVFDDTRMSCTIGTSGALRIAVSKPLLDTRQRTWCYCFTRDTWVAGGAINNGGIVLKWLRDGWKNQFEFDAEALGMKNIYKLFDKYAEEIPPGSEGLIFLPFLTGERSPNWNANTVGTIHGLKLIHGKKHIVKAAMEAVIYRMYSLYEVIAGMGVNVKQIIANGGYANSDVWLRIQADIFGKDIAVAGITEAAAFGAAYVAMVFAGAVPNLKHPLPCMKPSRVVKPVMENHPIYKEMYKTFMELYSKIYG